MTEQFTPGATPCPSCGATYMKDQPWKRVCLDCYLQAKGRAARSAPTPAFEPDMLRRLIQLCHPDKHGNSEAANTATRFLLGLKEVQHG